MNCLLNFSVIVAALAFFCWISSPYIFVDIETAHDSFLHVKYSPDMNPLSSPPETLLDISGNYNFGRYNAPIKQPVLHDMNIAQRIFQTKEWQFHAASDGRVLIGLAIANMGYIESGFLYICDMVTGFHDKISVVMPGGMGAGVVAPSSVTNCSSFSSSSLESAICFDENLNGWRVTAQASLELKSHVEVDIVMLRSSSAQDEFAMVYPLGPHRPAYTHKTSALTAHGSFSLQSELPGHGTDGRRPFIGTGLTDFTRAMSRRFTEWFWVAFSFDTDVEAAVSACENMPSADSRECATEDKARRAVHGVQLSQGVYRPLFHWRPSSSKQKSPHSGDMENIIWMNHRAFYLDSVLTFAYSPANLPARPGHGHLRIGQEMYITSRDERINLTYTAVAQMPTEITTPVFSGALLHTYGVYSGSISAPGPDGVDEVLLLSNIPGILEDHYAHW